MPLFTIFHIVPQANNANLEYPTNCNLQSWQGHGEDIHSLVADPQFANADAANFTLLPTSPALSLGFQQVDTSTVGPRVPVPQVLAGL